MPDSRKARRQADPGLQPERTSLAWFRTLLGYGALLALAIKHHWHQAGIAFWISLCILASGRGAVLAVSGRTGDGGGYSLAIYPQPECHGRGAQRFCSTARSS